MPGIIPEELVPLEILLEGLEPAPRVVHALFAQQKAALPQLRVFVDFLAELFAPNLAMRRRRH